MTAGSHKAFELIANCEDFRVRVRGIQKFLNRVDRLLGLLYRRANDIMDN